MNRKPSPATELRRVKRELKEARLRILKLERKLLWGQMMSNICFNLKQRAALDEAVRKNMEDCQKGWDAA